MPRKPRNPGTGKAPVNTPANGHGWGGPAKGAHDPPPRKPENLVPAAALAVCERAPNGQFQPTLKRLLTDENAAKAIKVYVDVLESKTETVFNKIAAAEKFLDRHMGKPVAVNVNKNIDDVSKLSDEQLRSELAAARREAIAAVSGGEKETT